MAVQAAEHSFLPQAAREQAVARIAAWVPPA
jgi:hypothetical protein